MDVSTSAWAYSLGCAVTAAACTAFIKYFRLHYIWFHPVEENSIMHGGEVVAKVLQSHGVKSIFTLVGGHISPILVAAEKSGMKVVDTRHEASAVFAADAAARLSQTIGVAAVTAGPGVTNTVTAVKNAQLAETPILLLGGAAATILKGRGALQDIDQISLFKSICKYCVTVKTVREIAPALRTAIKEALSGTPGPVFVEFPVDVLYPYETVKKEVLGSRSSSSLHSKVVQWFLNNYVQNIFAGAWEEQDLTPLKPDIPMPKRTQVQKCVELLSRAKKPLMLIGSQATLPPVPIQQLRSAVEKLGIPVYLGGMARGLLGARSPIQFRHQRGNALKEADLIILAGSICDFRLQYGRVIPRSAKVICINRNKEQLFKNAGVFWTPSVPVQSDVATFIVKLVEQPGGSLALGIDDWLRELRDREDAKQKANEKMALNPSDKYLNPMRVLFELDKVLPDNAILIADGGDFVATAAYILRPRGPLQWLDPGAFGTLGVGGGFALGAKVCHPDCQVWIIYGDGACGFSIAEIDSMHRQGLHVISIVGNDAGWTQILREQKPMLGSSVACTLAFTDYHEVARGFGAQGLLMKYEEEDIEGTLRRAQDISSRSSVLINVLIGKTKFRDGSISV